MPRREFCGFIFQRILSYNRTMHEKFSDKRLQNISVGSSVCQQLVVRKANPRSEVSRHRSVEAHRRRLLHGRRGFPQSLRETRRLGMRRDVFFHRLRSERDCVCRNDIQNFETGRHLDQSRTIVVSLQVI